MKRLTRDKQIFYFDKDIPPAIVVEPGESIEIETEDALAGQLSPETVAKITFKEMRMKIPCTNPLTGPIFVKDAEPGDYLVVNIERIDVSPDDHYAWTLFVSNEGMLTNSSTLNEPLPEAKRILPIRDGYLHFQFKKKTVKVPVNPAIGTIGVAPVGERRYSMFNGCEFLGNVDIPALGVGKSLVLPVHVKGALLSMGDIHAVSGDGEISGGASDCRGIVQITIDLLKGSHHGFIELPQLNCDGFIGSIATGSSLDTSVKLAYRDLIFRMHHDYQFDLIEAYQLLASVGEVQIGQILPPIFHSALALIKRKFL